MITIFLTLSPAREPHWRPSAGLARHFTVRTYDRRGRGDSAPYVRRGPPPTPQRVLGPALVLTSAAVLGTGVLLAFTPRSRWA
jgi:hypothetical protein